MSGSDPQHELVASPSASVDDLIATPAQASADTSIVESLEIFLDGELLDGDMSAAQAEAFRRTADNDPALKLAIARLTADRESRHKFFQTLERHDSAEDVVVGQLLASVERAIDADERRALARSDRMRMVRYVAAAAACVIFSFSAGWIGHSHSKWSLPLGPLNSSEPLDASVGSAGSGTFISNLISSNGDRQPVAADPANGGVNVVLKDHLGNIVGIHHFASPEDAHEFIQNIGRSQQRQQQLHEGDSFSSKDHF